MKPWQQEQPTFIILLVFRLRDILAPVIELHGWFIKLCSCCLWRHLGNRGNWWTYWVTLAAYETVAAKVKDTNTSSTLHLSSLSTHRAVSDKLSYYELLWVIACAYVPVCMYRTRMSRACPTKRSDSINIRLLNLLSSVALWTADHSQTWNFLTALSVKERKWFDSRLGELGCTFFVSFNTKRLC